MTANLDPGPLLAADLDRRIAITVACRATDALAKVDDAGGFRMVGDREVQVMHNGVLVLRDGYLGGWQTEVIRQLRGHHEPQEELVFHHLLERLARDGEGRAMVELGAYWAYYLCWFGTRFPGAQLVGVEPEGPFRAVGMTNLALNGLDGEILEGVVGPHPGEWLEFPSALGGTARLQQVGLGQLAAARGLDHLDLVLADIQGAELSLLQAAAEELRSGLVRFLVISTHDVSISGSPTTHREVVAAVEDLGGHVIAEHSVSESCSGDGLVAASFDARDREFSVEVPHVRAIDSLFGEWEPRMAASVAEAAASQRHRRMAEEALSTVAARDEAIASLQATVEDLQAQLALQQRRRRR